ncbi:MAG: thioredoxin domain-containing protein [Bacteroidales bacterium]|nr:thioredoxin domain-containing protein [Bacteroidales bacterium]
MKLFLTLLLLGGTLHATEKMNTVRVELEGKRYDSLYLRLSLEDFWQPKNIRGYSEDGYRWEFSYPDSLYDYITSFRLYDNQVFDTVAHFVCFNLDALSICNYFFERPFLLVRARYVETRTHLNELMRRRGTDEDVFGTFIHDIFEIYTDNQELISSMKRLRYGYGFFSGQRTYEESLQRNMEFVRQYPDSRTMIALLSGTVGQYKSKADIFKVFNLFTEELQQSFYGQKIYKHITRVDTIFKNQMLSTWDIGNLEAIIQDSSKYNLILFSASWCAPCTRQIPVLKEIYQDLGQKLIMTYVSVDEERSAEAWRIKMRDHEIPWRSVMASDMKATYEKYEIFGVPHAILVYPSSMKMKKLDLWKEEDRQRLYELVK